MMIAEKESPRQISKTAHRLSCSGPAYEEHKRFWSTRLQDMQPFCFRQKDTHTIAETGRPEQFLFSLDPALAVAISDQVGGNDTGIFICLLAAWSILLQKYSGQQRTVIDTLYINLPCRLRYMNRQFPWSLL